ncbi:MAG: helix-turn-helix transcriptional regulator, partial [Psychrilyobacter sp.]|uniref:helix-turn-helix domain-containing protein n=1 Tax=Psychrilyobacter sp. TaxID=2586924 RepID=UPI003C78990C
KNKKGVGIMEEKKLLQTKRLIKEYLIENGLNYKKFSNQIGVSENTVKTYLGGKKFISIKFLKKFSKMKGLSLENRVFIQEIIDPQNTGNVNMKINKNRTTNPSEFKQTQDLKKLLKKLDLFVTGYIKEDEEKGIITQGNSLRSDYDSINRIVKVLHILNENTNRYSSEILLLLETNSTKENKKIKKGINSVANNLISIGEQLKSFVNDDYIDIN